MATRSPIASNSDASSVAPATSLRCAASSTGKRNACGVWARNRPSRGTVAAIRPSATSFSVSATGTAGIAPGSVLQGRQQGRDGPRRDQRPRRVVHQHDIRCRGLQRLQPGPHAVLARGAPGTGGRCGRPLKRRFDRRRRRRPAAADRRGRPAPRRRGGSPAFRRAAETASASRRRIGCRTRRPPGSLRSACRQRCRPAGWRQQRQPDRSRLSLRVRNRHPAGAETRNASGVRAISHCTSACVSLICPIDEQVS